ncbi:MAG: cellulase family glycosylhydrolase [Anaerolineae bacterium]
MRRSTRASKLMLAVLVLIYFGSCSTSAAQRGSTSVGQTFGINLNGGEFTDGKPGSYGDKYVYPGIDYLDFRYGYEMDYLASKRLKLVRYAFRWEQLQHDYYGPLTPLDVQGLDLALQNAQTHGLHLILDMHNYGRFVGGTEYAFGSPEVPNAAYADVWRKLAEHFRGQPALYAYSIANEPIMLDCPNCTYYAAAQAVIAAIREVDTDTPIIISPPAQSPACWTCPEYGTEHLLELHDPSNKLIFDAHIYFDTDEVGEYPHDYDWYAANLPGFGPDMGAALAQPYVDWLRAHNQRGIFGEYGIPDDDPRWNVILDNFLTYAEGNSDVILGGAYWSSGPWWDAYPLSVEPQNGADRPQMAVLTKHTRAAVAPAWLYLPYIVR